MHNVDVLASNKIYQGYFLVFTSIFKQCSLSLREIFDDIPDHVAQCCGGCPQSVFNCTAVLSRSHFCQKFLLNPFISSSFRISCAIFMEN